MAQISSSSPSRGGLSILDDQDALPPGTRFGELEILSVIGVGGFGIVYLAMDHALERQVALKEYMPSTLAGRSDDHQVSVRSQSHAQTYALGLRSFVNEARLLARFNHPSLVKVYRFWEENGTAYMVMPYLQGRTLREVRRAMPAAPDQAWIISVIRPLLDALEQLHREAVYHRDIAPDNILLPPNELPVLLDFGAARRAIGDRTQTFTAILKPSYAPIEQYAESAAMRQGPWTDIYALGAVIYYLLKGSPPPPATARALHDDLPMLAHESAGGSSTEFLSAVDWMLAVRPDDRPQSIAALREVIEGRASVPPRVAPEASPVAVQGFSAGAAHGADESFDPEATRIRHAGEAPTVMPEQPPHTRTSIDPDETVVIRGEELTALKASVAASRMSGMPVMSQSMPMNPMSKSKTGLWLVMGSCVLLLFLLGVVLMFDRSKPDEPLAAQPPTVAVSSEPAVAVATASAPIAPAAGEVPQAASAAALAASAAVELPAVVASAPAPTPEVAPSAPLQVEAPPVAAAEPPPAKPVDIARERDARQRAAAQAVEAARARSRFHREAAARAQAQARDAQTAAAFTEPEITGIAIQPQAPSSNPRDVCGKRAFLAQAVCMEERCREARFAKHPQCVEVRAIEERRRRNEY